MNNNSNSRMFHHFIPKSMPCILVPSPITSAILNTPLTSMPDQSNDHILNLSASMIKHCPLQTPENKKMREKMKEKSVEGVKCVPEVEKTEKSINLISKSDQTPECDSSKSSLHSHDKPHMNVDMNCNKVKLKETRDRDDDKYPNSPAVGECDSYLSDSFSDDEQITEIDVNVDDSLSGSDEDMDPEHQISQTRETRNDLINKNSRKDKILTFGIDRILSNAGQDKEDQKSPPSSPAPSSPVVSNLSSKLATSTELISSRLLKDEHDHHSILSKLRLCATASSTPTLSSSSNSENQKRASTTTLPFFHHSYGPYHHHHHSPHMTSIITSASGGGIHNHNSHQQHPLSNCSECLFLRRYCGGGIGRTNSGACNRTNNIPSSSSASANTAAANNMQFSSSMATPCGPTSSLSASFTWMANPSIYDNSSIISPVAGYNQHIPLQPSFGLGGSNFSTLTSIQQCGNGGTSGRRKRSWSRAVFSNLQRKGLEKRFQLQKYITKPDRRQLAATLGLTDAQVKVWFQNRRMKWRHSKEGKVSSGTGEGGSNIVPTSSSSPPVTSTTSSKGDGAMKDKK